MEYQDTEQKRKIRIVTIATVIAVVVLGLGVWLVVAAISSTKKNTNPVATESSLTETTKSEKTEKEEQKGNPNATSPANQYGATEKTTTATTSTTTATPAPAKEEVPTTGPAEDMMLVALLAGVATYLIGLNFNLKKQTSEQNA